jgi:undecaprenyl-phosphate galactose phosphotransferase
MLSLYSRYSWAGIVQLLADIAAIIFSFYVTHLVLGDIHSNGSQTGLFFWGGGGSVVTALLYFILAFFLFISFAFKGHYSRRKSFWDETGDLLYIITMVIALNIVAVYFAGFVASRLWLVLAWGLAFFLILIARIWVRMILRRLSIWSRPAVVIGCGRNASEAIRALNDEVLLGLDVRSILVPEGLTMPPASCFPAHVHIRSLGPDPLSALSELGNPPVILALDMGQWESQEKMVRLLSNRYRKLIISPPLHDLPLFGLEMIHLFNHEVIMLKVRDNLARPGAQIVKRLFDILMTVLMLLFLVLPMGIIAMLIRRGDGGSVFYWQERLGRNGKPFHCFKFRSMVVNADTKLQDYLENNPASRDEFERTHKLRDDPRISGIGLFLRRTSLDELPQLINVLRGEMSLVGPRPVPDWELLLYGDSQYFYNQVRPGITGLWQTSGRSKTTFAERVAMDTWYVKNWSLWYDIVILLRTVKVVFKRDGAY